MGAHVVDAPPDEGAVDHVLGRFRPAERQSWTDEFLSRAGSGGAVNRIIVATQVVEAGVDMSSPAPVEATLRLFARRVEELESLLAEK